MKYLSIPQDRDKILSAIEKRGWQAEALNEDDLDWWLAEAYRLTSLSDPARRSAYLLFKVDPMCDFGREKDEVVWSGSICDEIPDHYLKARDHVIAGRLEADLPALLDELENLKCR